MPKANPRYIKGAKFIDEDDEVDADWWPRHPPRYDPTDNFQSRMRRLSGIIDGKDVKKAIEEGDIYRAANENVAFVNDLGGLAIYVVVDAKLQKRGDEYPTNPMKSDYYFKGVTVWPYIYDRDDAWGTGRWSSKELDIIEQIKKENAEVYL